MKDINIDNVEDLKDDLDELMAENEQVNEFWVNQAEAGNEEAMDELNQLEAEMAAEELEQAQVNQAPIAASNPVGVPA